MASSETGWLEMDCSSSRACMGAGKPPGMATTNRTSLSSHPGPCAAGAEGRREECPSHSLGLCINLQRKAGACRVTFPSSPPPPHPHLQITQQRCLQRTARRRTLTEQTQRWGWCSCGSWAGAGLRSPLCRLLCRSRRGPGGCRFDQQRPGYVDGHGLGIRMRGKHGLEPFSK